MVRSLLRHLSTLALAIASVTSAHAAPARSGSVERAYVGAYTRDEGAVIARLLLLEDRSFCLTVRGGTPEQRVAGQWKATPGGGVRLQEGGPEHQPFPAWAARGNATPLVAFRFIAPALGQANHPVFAVSSGDELPTRFRPLFAANVPTSDAPLTLRAQARHAFIGALEEARPGQPARLRVVQYKLEDVAELVMGFDAAPTVSPKPAMTLNARLDGDVLRLNNMRFGLRQGLDSPRAQEARDSCGLAARTVAAASAAGVGSAPHVPAAVRPVKTHWLDAAVVDGTPWFGNSAP